MLPNLRSVFWEVDARPAKCSKCHTLHEPNNANVIAVVSSRLFVVPIENGYLISVIGKLCNSETVAVGVITPEIRMMDKDCGLLDSGIRSLLDHHVPNDDVSFKIPASANIHMPKDAYADHTVFVRMAKHSVDRV